VITFSSRPRSTQAASNMDVAKVKSQMHSLAIGQAMGKAAEDYKKVGGARHWARESLQRVCNHGLARQAAQSPAPAAAQLPPPVCSPL
jgi:hypothetical protein